MKIAVLHPYPPNIGYQIPILPGNAQQGGGETSSFYNALSYANTGHEVTYYTGKYPGITIDKLVINPNLKVVYLKSYLNNLGLACPPKLFTELLFTNFDLIHSQQIPMMYSVIGGFAAKLSGKKFIMTFHGRLPYCFIDKYFGIISSYFANFVTVQSKFSYNKISKLVPISKLRIIPNGVDTKIFHKVHLKGNEAKKYIKKNEKILLYVGRLIPAKGLHILINALSKINDEKTKLIIIGDGILSRELKSYSNDLNLSERVIFKGILTANEIVKYYSIADVLILPSVTKDINGKIIKNASENFGNVLSEAMACKLPVIVSNVGGMKDWIINKYNGLTFEESNLDELVEKIELILKDKKLSKKLIDNAYKDIILKYSWKAVINNFIIEINNIK